MKFDIESTVKSMVSAAKGSVGDDAPEAKETAQQFLEMNKNRLAKLAQYRITGKLSAEDFKSRMEDERKMLEAQFNTMKIISKVMAQNAANAAIRVLEDAVQAALSI